MKKILAIFLLLGCSFSYAQDQQLTNNLITTLSPTVPATAPMGFSGGSSVGYNSTTNTYYFGYTQQTVGQVIAINNALQGSGVQVGGVNYGMSYLNGGDTYGTLGLTVNVTSNTGSVLNTYSHSFNTIDPNWKTFDQTQMFTTPYSATNLGNVSMQITGKDSRFWAGYYGPQVQNPYLKLVYTAEVPTVTYPTFGDDTYVAVPLKFGFPFYGRTFTNSWMHSNGVVSFFDPAVPMPIGGGVTSAGAWAFCCGEQPTTTRPEFSFMIAPLMTDLYPSPTSSFKTEGTSTYQKYFWNNIGEISNGNNLNSFSLEIRPTGFIGVNYDKINIQNQGTWVGTTGDITLGQINERFWGAPGLNAHLSSIPNWSLNNTPDACASNPLLSPSCPGYTDAMCTINPLYTTSCPGYQQAYFTQQCSANPLYNPSCPGYAAAYLEYQCSINPLYSTTCSGYETAYFNQQCSLNPLYSTRCPGYTTAYHDQQCSINPLYATDCNGYATAYHDQQCSINPLYMSDCNGYAAAYKSQQCSLNPLYATDCPGYAQAYFNQQCSLNGLYDRTCPNYAEAYAKKNVLSIATTTTSTSATTTTVTDTNTVATGTVSPTGTVAATTESITTQLSSGISDSTVSNAVTTKASTANAEAAPAAPVKLTAPAPAPTTQMAQAEPKKDTNGPKDEKKEEGNKQNASGSNISPSGSESKPSDGPKTARQELAERRREAAAKEAVAKGKDLANEMGKASDMEAQKAVQNVVIQAMGFTPGFDTYNKAMLPDSRFYAPKIVYGGQVNVDNKFVSRRLMGGSDKLHQDMVDSQYER